MNGLRNDLKKRNLKRPYFPDVSSKTRNAKRNGKQNGGDNEMKRKTIQIIYIDIYIQGRSYVRLE